MNSRWKQRTGQPLLAIACTGELPACARTLAGLALGVASVYCLLCVCVRVARAVGAYSYMFVYSYMYVIYSYMYMTEQKEEKTACLSQRSVEFDCFTQSREGALQHHEESAHL